MHKTWRTAMKTNVNKFNPRRTFCVFCSFAKEFTIECIFVAILVLIHEALGQLDTIYKHYISLEKLIYYPF